MPRGEPNKQTIASAKYQKKAGYISKSFKLKKDITEQFAKACEKAGLSQASVITEFMRSFIQRQNVTES
jgi:hypothetical protein